MSAEAAASSASQKNQSNEISGFPELSLSEEIVMQTVMQQIKEKYASFGYIPYESRLVEHLETLTEKGIDGKEVFVLNMLHKGEVREKSETEQIHALRFDLTVPFSRFVGQNYKTLPFPLKRYQVQKVYRGETARESLGRFCEFYQSDIDVIGKDSLDLAYDSEFPCVIYKIFREVIGIERFVIRINNRKLLEGLFQEYGMNDPTKLRKAVKIIDNMEKVPIEDTTAALVALDLSVEHAANIQRFFDVSRTCRPENVIKAYRQLNIKSPVFRQGLDELSNVIQGIIANGVPPQYFMVDPSIARGLDYYTGTVYETTLLDHRHLGSVCSGGRFDDLVGTLSGDKNLKFPGCGISIGLSRLIPALIRAGVLRANTMTMAPVLIAVQDSKYMDAYNAMAKILRSAGIGTAVNYNGGRLKQQIEYAAKCGFKILLIGREELEQGNVQVKLMNSGTENTVVHFTNLVQYVGDLLKTTDSGFKTQPVPNDRQFSEKTEAEILAELQASLV